MTRRTVLAAAPLGATLALALVLACSTSSVKCDLPLTLCSPITCADLRSDPQHCGTCGKVCSTGETCISGACACPTGTVPCDGLCVSLSSDPKNCGACGHDCGALLCVPGKTGAPECGCPAGGCACPAGQSLVDGTCQATVFAACFNTGELVALDDDLRVQTTRITIGGGPQSIAYGAGKALVADTIDNALYSVDPTTVPVAKAAGSDRLDTVANQVIVRGQKAYVVSSGDNMVQVIDLSKATPTAVGATGRIADEIPMSLATPPAAQTTNPSFAAFAGDKLYVTLLGTCDATGDLAGNRLLELDVSTVPGKVTRELAFAAADYEKDAGAAANSPRPAALAAVGTKLYVAIGNLNSNCWGTAGPGYLAVVDTAAAPMTSTPIKLPDTCRNPSFVVASATRVYVSCLGSYGSAATVQESLVVLDPATNAVLKTTTFQRCSDAFETGPAACKTAVPGRMALHGNKLLIADNNAGRLLVTDLDGNLISGLETGVALCPLKCPNNDTTKTCYQFIGDVAAVR